jgi:uncharacterized protein (DUF2062 family)
MPRKHFRRYLPSHEVVRASPVVRFFGSWLHHHNLWHLHRRSVAGGFAVGLFAGMIPGPLQMLTAAILAMLLRVNLPVAVLATWFTNPVTIVPLYILAYKLGVLFMGSDGTAAPELTFELTNKGFTDWLPALLAWLATLGKPFVVGLLLLAVLLAAAGYVFVIVGWRLYVALAWRKRAAARACQRRNR